MEDALNKLAGKAGQDEPGKVLAIILGAKYIDNEGVFDKEAYGQDVAKVKDGGTMQNIQTLAKWFGSTPEEMSIGLLYNLLITIVPVDTEHSELVLALDSQQKVSIRIVEGMLVFNFEGRNWVNSQIEMDGERQSVWIPVTVDKNIITKADDPRVAMFVQREASLMFASGLLDVKQGKHIFIPSEEKRYSDVAGKLVQDGSWIGNRLLHTDSDEAFVRVYRNHKGKILFIQNGTTLLQINYPNRTYAVRVEMEGGATLTRVISATGCTVINPETKKPYQPGSLIREPMWEGRIEGSKAYDELRRALSEAHLDITFIKEGGVQIWQWLRSLQNSDSLVFVTRAGAKIVGIRDSEQAITFAVAPNLLRVSSFSAFGNFISAHMIVSDNEHKKIATYDFRNEQSFWTLFNKDGEAIRNTKENIGTTVRGQVGKHDMSFTLSASQKAPSEFCINVDIGSFGLLQEGKVNDSSFILTPEGNLVLIQDSPVRNIFAYETGPIPLREATIMGQGRVEQNISLLSGSIFTLSMEPIDMQVKINKEQMFPVGTNIPEWLAREFPQAVAGGVALGTTGEQSKQEGQGRLSNVIVVKHNEHGYYLTGYNGNPAVVHLESGGNFIMDEGTYLVAEAGARINVNGKAYQNIVVGKQNGVVVSAREGEMTPTTEIGGIRLTRPIIVTFNPSSLRFEYDIEALEGQNLSGRINGQNITMGVYQEKGAYYIKSTITAECGMRLHIGDSPYVIGESIQMRINVEGAITTLSDGRFLGTIDVVDDDGELRREAWALEKGASISLAGGSLTVLKGIAKFAGEDFAICPEFIINAAEGEGTSGPSPNTIDEVASHTIEIESMGDNLILRGVYAGDGKRIGEIAIRNNQFVANEGQLFALVGDWRGMKVNIGGVEVTATDRGTPYKEHLEARNNVVLIKSGKVLTRKEGLVGLYGQGRMVGIGTERPIQIEQEFGDGTIIKTLLDGKFTLTVDDGRARFRTDTKVGRYQKEVERPNGITVFSFNQGFDTFSAIIQLKRADQANRGKWIYTEVPDNLPAELCRHVASLKDYSLGAPGTAELFNQAGEKIAGLSMGGGLELTHLGWKSEGGSISGELGLDRKTGVFGLYNVTLTHFDGKIETSLNLEGSLTEKNMAYFFGTASQRVTDAYGKLTLDKGLKEIETMTAEYAGKIAGFRSCGAFDFTAGKGFNSSLNNNDVVLTIRDESAGMSFVLTREIKCLSGERIKQAFDLARGRVDLTDPEDIRRSQLAFNKLSFTLGNVYNGMLGLGVEWQIVKDPRDPSKIAFAMSYTVRNDNGFTVRLHALDFDKITREGLQTFIAYAGNDSYGVRIDDEKGPIDATNEVRDLVGNIDLTFAVFDEVSGKGFSIQSTMDYEDRITIIRTQISRRQGMVFEATAIVASPSEKDVVRLDNEAIERFYAEAEKLAGGNTPYFSVDNVQGSIQNMGDIFGRIGFTDIRISDAISGRGFGANITPENDVMWTQVMRGGEWATIDGKRIEMFKEREVSALFSKPIEKIEPGGTGGRLGWWKSAVNWCKSETDWGRYSVFGKFGMWLGKAIGGLVIRVVDGVARGVYDIVGRGIVGTIGDVAYHAICFVGSIFKVGDGLFYKADWSVARDGAVGIYRNLACALAGIFWNVRWDDEGFRTSKYKTGLAYVLKGVFGDIVWDGIIDNIRKSGYCAWNSPQRNERRRIELAKRGMTGEGYWGTVKRFTGAGVAGGVVVGWIVTAATLGLAWPAMVLGAAKGGAIGLVLGLIVGLGVRQYQYNDAERDAQGKFTGVPHGSYAYTAGNKFLDNLAVQAKSGGRFERFKFEAANVSTVIVGVFSLGIGRWDIHPDSVLKHKIAQSGPLSHFTWEGVTTVCVVGLLIAATGGLGGFVAVIRGGVGAIPALLVRAGLAIERGALAIGRAFPAIGRGFLAMGRAATWQKAWASAFRIAKSSRAFLSGRTRLAIGRAFPAIDRGFLAMRRATTWRTVRAGLSRIGRSSGKKLSDITTLPSRLSHVTPSLLRGCREALGSFNKGFRTLHMPSNSKIAMINMMGTGARLGRIWAYIDMCVYVANAIYQAVVTGRTIDGAEFRKGLVAAGVRGFITGFVFAGVLNSLATIAPRVTNWAGSLAQSSKRLSTFEVSTLIIGGSATTSVMVDLMGGRINRDNWGRNLLNSAMHGVLWGSLIAYAVSPSGIRHIGRAFERVAGMGATGETIIGASLRGARDWLVVAPSFTILASAWSSLGGAMSTGRWGGLMLEDGTLLLSGKGLVAIVASIITAPSSGKWMGPMVAIFSTSFRKPSLYTIEKKFKGGLLQLLEESPGLLSKMVTLAEYCFRGAQGRKTMLEAMPLATRSMSGLSIFGGLLGRVESLSTMALYVSIINRGVSTFAKGWDVNGTGLSNWEVGFFGWAFLFMIPHFTYEDAEGAILAAAREEYRASVKGKEPYKGTKGVFEAMKIAAENGGGKKGLAAAARHYRIKYGKALKAERAKVEAELREGGKADLTPDAIEAFARYRLRDNNSPALRMKNLMDRAGENYVTITGGACLTAQDERRILRATEDVIRLKNFGPIEFSTARLQTFVFLKNIGPTPALEVLWNVATKGIMRLHGRGVNIRSECVKEIAARFIRSRYLNKESRNNLIAQEKALRKGKRTIEICGQELGVPKGSVELIRKAFVGAIAKKSTLGGLWKLYQEHVGDRIWQMGLMPEIVSRTPERKLSEIREKKSGETVMVGARRDRVKIEITDSLKRLITFLEFAPRLGLSHSQMDELLDRYEQVSEARKPVVEAAEDWYAIIVHDIVNGRRTKEIKDLLAKKVAPQKEVEAKKAMVAELVKNLKNAWERPAWKGLKHRYKKLQKNGRETYIRMSIKDWMARCYRMTDGELKEFAQGSGFKDPFVAIALATEIMRRATQRVKGRVIEPDPQQLAMLALLLESKMVGVDVGAGKTFPNVLMMLVYRFTLGKDLFRGIITDPSEALPQYKQDEYKEMFELAGLKVFDGVEHFERNDIEGIISAMKDGNTVVLLDPTVQTHLVNLWATAGRRGIALKMAMLRSHLTLIDEFHDPMQSPMSAIIAGLTQNLDAKGAHKDYYEKAVAIWQALRQGGIEYEASPEGKKGKFWFENKAGTPDFSEGALDFLYKTLKGRVDVGKKGKKGKDSGIVEAILKGMNMVRRAEAGEGEEFGIGEKGAIHPIENGKLAENSHFQSVYMQLGIAFARGEFSPEQLARLIKVSRTEMSTSLSLVLSNIFSFVSGASGTIGGLDALTMSKLGTGQVNLSALTARGAISAKIKGGITRKMIIGRGEASEAMGVVVRRAIRDARQKAVIIANPLLTDGQVEALKQALKESGYQRKYQRKIEVIGSRTHNAIAIAENARKGDIIIVGRSGFTALDYGKVENPDALMIVLNADAIPNDLLAQLLGRIGRHGEKAKYLFHFNEARMKANEQDIMHPQIREILLNPHSEGRLRERDQKTLNKMSKGEEVSFTDRLILNSSYLQKKAIAEAMRFSVRDVLSNTMLIGPLKSFLEVPGIPEREKTFVRKELERRLEHREGIVEFCAEVKGKGTGEAFVREAVSGALVEAYEVLRALRGRVFSKEGRALIKRQRAMLKELGDARGNIKNFGRIEPIEDSAFASMESYLSYRHLVGVTKNLAKFMMPSEGMPGGPVPRIIEDIVKRVDEFAGPKKARELAKNPEGLPSIAEQLVRAQGEGKSTLIGVPAYTAFMLLNIPGDDRRKDLKGAIANILSEIESGNWNKLSDDQRVSRLIEIATANNVSVKPLFRAVNPSISYAEMNQQIFEHLCELMGNLNGIVNGSAELLPQLNSSVATILAERDRFYYLLKELEGAETVSQLRNVVEKINKLAIELGIVAEDENLISTEEENDLAAKLRTLGNKELRKAREQTVNGVEKKLNQIYRNISPSMRVKAFEDFARTIRQLSKSGYDFEEMASDVEQLMTLRTMAQSSFEKVSAEVKRQRWQQMNHQMIQKRGLLGESSEEMAGRVFDSAATLMKMGGLEEDEWKEVIDSANRTIKALRGKDNQYEMQDMSWPAYILRQSLADLLLAYPEAFISILPKGWKNKLQTRLRSVEDAILLRKPVPEIKVPQVRKAGKGVQGTIVRFDGTSVRYTYGLNRISREDFAYLKESIKQNRITLEIFEKLVSFAGGWVNFGDKIKSSRGETLRIPVLVEGKLKYLSPDRELAGTLFELFEVLGPITQGVSSQARQRLALPLDYKSVDEMTPQEIDEKFRKIIHTAFPEERLPEHIELELIGQGVDARVYGVRNTGKVVKIVERGREEKVKRADKLVRNTEFVAPYRLVEEDGRLYIDQERGITVRSELIRLIAQGDIEGANELIEKFTNLTDKLRDADIYISLTSKSSGNILDDFGLFDSKVLVIDFPNLTDRKGKNVLTTEEAVTGKIVEGISIRPEDLLMIPGIGEGIVANIIEYMKRSKITTWGELLRNLQEIEGIGSERSKTISEWVDTFVNYQEALLVSLAPRQSIPIVRKGPQYSKEGASVISPTKVSEIEAKPVALASSLAKAERGLPTPKELERIINIILRYYRAHGIRAPDEYSVEIRRNLERPASIEGNTIILDTDLFKISPDDLLPFLTFAFGHEGMHPIVGPEEKVVQTDKERFASWSPGHQASVLRALKTLGADEAYIQWIEMASRVKPKQKLSPILMLRGPTLKQRLARAVKDIWDESPDLDRSNGWETVKRLQEKDLGLWREAVSYFGGAGWVAQFASLLAKSAENRWDYTNPELLGELLGRLQESDERWLIAIDGEPGHGKTTLWCAIQAKDVVLGELLEEMEFVEGEKQLFDWHREVMRDEELPFDIAYGLETDREQQEYWASQMAKKHERPMGMHGNVKRQIMTMFANGSQNIDGFCTDFLKSVEDRIIVYNANSSHSFVDKVLVTDDEFPFFRVAKVRVIANRDGSRSLKIQYSTVGAQPSPAAPTVEAEQALVGTESFTRLFTIFGAGTIFWAWSTGLGHTAPALQDELSQAATQVSQGDIARATLAVVFKAAAILLGMIMVGIVVKYGVRALKRWSDRKAVSRIVQEAERELDRSEFGRARELYNLALQRLARSSISREKFASGLVPIRLRLLDQEYKLLFTAISGGPEELEQLGIIAYRHLPEEIEEAAIEPTRIRPEAGIEARPITRRELQERLGKVRETLKGALEGVQKGGQPFNPITARRGDLYITPTGKVVLFEGISPEGKLYYFRVLGVPGAKTYAISPEEALRGYKQAEFGSELLRPLHMPLIEVIPQLRQVEIPAGEVALRGIEEIKAEWVEVIRAALSGQPAVGRSDFRVYEAGTLSAAGRAERIVERFLKEGTIPENGMEREALIRAVSEVEVGTLAGEPLNFSQMVLREVPGRENIERTLFAERGLTLEQLLHELFRNRPGYMREVVYFYLGVLIPEGAILSGFEREFLSQSLISRTLQLLHELAPEVGFNLAAERWAQKVESLREEYGAVLLKRLALPEKRQELVSAIAEEVKVVGAELRVRPIVEAIEQNRVEQLTLPEKEIVLRAVMRVGIWNHGSSLWQVLEQAFRVGRGQLFPSQIDEEEIKLTYMPQEQYESLEEEIAREKGQEVFIKSRAMLRVKETGREKWQVEVILNGEYNTLGGLFYRALHELIYAMILNVQGRMLVEGEVNRELAGLINYYLTAGGILERLEEGAQYTLSPEMLELIMEVPQMGLSREIVPLLARAMPALVSSASEISTYEPIVGYEIGPEVVDFEGTKVFVFDLLSLFKVKVKFGEITVEPRSPAAFKVMENIARLAEQEGKFDKIRFAFVSNVRGLSRGVMEQMLIDYMRDCGLPPEVIGQLVDRRLVLDRITLGQTGRRISTRDVCNAVLRALTGKEGEQVTGIELTILTDNQKRWRERVRKRWRERMREILWIILSPPRKGEMLSTATGLVVAIEGQLSQSLIDFIGANYKKEEAEKLLDIIRRDKKVILPAAPVPRKYLERMEMEKKIYKVQA